MKPRVLEAFRVRLGFLVSREGVVMPINIIISWQKPTGSPSSFSQEKKFELRTAPEE